MRRVEVSIFAILVFLLAGCNSDSTGAPESKMKDGEALKDLKLQIAKQDEKLESPLRITKFINT